MSMVIVAGCVAGFANIHVVTKPRHDGKEMEGLVWMSVVILLSSLNSLYYRKIPKQFRAEVNVFIAMQKVLMLLLAVVELFVNPKDRAAVLAGDFFMVCSLLLNFVLHLLVRTYTFTIAYVFRGGVM